MGEYRFCPNCGKPLPAGASFCGECGHRITGEEQNTVAEPVRQQLSEAMTQRKEEPMRFPGGRQMYGQSAAEWSSCQGIYAKIPFSEETKKKYFSYRGRLNRWAYFCRSITIGILGGITLLVLGGLADAIGGAIGAVMMLLCVLVYLCLMVPAIMLAVRRLHDLDKTGWILLINFIPYVNIIVSLYILFAPGTRGANQYGDDPLEGKR